MNDFDNIKVEVTFKDAIGEERTFSSLKSIKEFIENEYVFWEELYNTFGNNNILSEIRNGFLDSKRAIDEYINVYLQWSEENRISELNNRIVKINQQKQRVVFSKTPFTNKLIEVIKLGSGQTEAFWKFLIDKKSIDVTTAQQLQGAILAYEFHYQNDSDITKRRNSERKALGELRKQLADKNDELITKSTSLFDNLNKDVDLFKEELTKWKQTTAEELSNQLNDDNSRKEEFFKNASVRIQELEYLYSEKLRLKEPADYWHKSAVHFRKVGFAWGIIVTLTTISSAIAFGWLFLEWLKSGQVIEKFSAQHWQGIILLASVLSLVAYLIRIFGKLTFSTLHLQRDAEEREQLCYLYLALANETKIDEESRRIILQSLFSRSDSGLLTGDHGPTMPGISDVISRKVGEK